MHLVIFTVELSGSQESNGTEYTNGIETNILYSINAFEYFLHPKMSLTVC